MGASAGGSVAPTLGRIDAKGRSLEGAPKAMPTGGGAGGWAQIPTNGNSGDFAELPSGGTPTLDMGMDPSLGFPMYDSPSSNVSEIGSGGTPQLMPIGGTGTTSGGSVFDKASGALDMAMVGTAGAMGYDPMMIGASGYNPATMRAGQLSKTDMSQYMNPYESSVIGGLQSDALRGQQMASNELGAQATAAKAFGGSRHGIAEGQMAGDIQRNLNNQIGNLRQSGYQNAQNMALADIQNRMSAGQANMNARNQARQFEAGNMMTAQGANQAAGLNAAQLRMNAANQMGGLGQTGFDMGRALNQDLQKQGLLQQMLQQQVIDNANAQYRGFTGSPQDAMAMYLAALQGSPQPGGTTTSNTSQSRSLWDYLSLLS